MLTNLGKKLETNTRRKNDAEAIYGVVVICVTQCRLSWAFFKVPGEGHLRGGCQPIDVLLLIGAKNRNIDILLLPRGELRLFKRALQR